MGHRESLLAGIAALIAVILAIIGYQMSSDQFWMSVLVNLSTTFLGIAVALVFIDTYLDRTKRRQAVRPLLRLVEPSIAQHHNSLMRDAFNKFGKPQFKEMVDRFKENNGDPLALTPEERRSLYQMVKDQRATLFPLIEKLELDLRELAQLLGWGFNPGVLRDSFACRYAITQLRAAQFDDSENDMAKVCEHFLDTDIMAFQVHLQLVETLGIAKSRVYGK